MTRREELQVAAENKAAELEAERKEYINSNPLAVYIENEFNKEVEAFKKADVASTGFNLLDKVLYGGLRTGLYTIGALSSLGKTTFIHNIADNIASSKRDVLYFSLEQTKLELVSKSINRLLYKKDPSTLFTSLSIRSGAVPGVAELLETYKNTAAENLYIYEREFKNSIENVEETIKAFREDYPERKPPVVIIEYLQILETVEEKKTVKEKIDYIVHTLKTISNKYNLPMIVISSFNRDNYLKVVDFSSFKESGGIEYTSDVVIGLQYSCMSSYLWDNLSDNLKRLAVYLAKKTDIREIQAIGLKNRYGKPSFEIDFNYYPTNDTIIELTEVQAKEAKIERNKKLKEMRKIKEANEVEPDPAKINKKPKSPFDNKYKLDNTRAKR